MSTFQQTPMHSLSPILLSPSSATITHHISLFDNSDQGSVDSDYTSLGSSKFYGHSGSTSSLNRQGRSQSIDELASSITTTIPTRHFNGTSHINKSNNDPLQFVKIHPNHELIERAQEQLSLAESRKRLQENYELPTITNIHKPIEEETDWSKAVDDWRKKREQKRLKNASLNNTDTDQSISSPLKTQSIPRPPEDTKILINEPVSKPTRIASPPPSNEPIKSKSPSPIRFKGPFKTREIFIEKPVDIRGFGFKLDGGRIQNRPVFISTIEEGSPADKAGLCVDDEVVSVNDENIENMPFDHVRKILKERNLRGTIKLIVRTYEEVADDPSQTLTTVPSADRSRTPSPQKAISSTTVPSVSIPIPKTNATTSSSSAIQIQTPVNTNSSNAPRNVPSPQVPTPSLNIFVPKPFRSNVTTNCESKPNHESELTFSRKELLTLMTIMNNEKQETNLPISPPRVVVNTPQTNVVQSLSPPVVPPPPPPPSSVEPFLHRNLTTESNTKQPRNDSPIAQVRSYVEKQMDQLQQDLEFGFSRTAKAPLSMSPPITIAREHQQQTPVNIPINYSNTPLSSSSIQTPQQDIIRSSLKKSSSTQNQLDQIPADRTYGLKIDPNEQVIHYLDPYSQPKLSTSFVKRSIPDLPSMTTMNRPSTAHSLERTINDLKLGAPEPYAAQTQILTHQQKKVTIQLGGKIPSQRITNKQIHATLNQAPRKTHFEDQAWINEDQRKPINMKSSARRSAPLGPHHQALQISKQPTYTYQDSHPRNGQHRNFDVSPDRQHRAKSPIRTPVNSRNDRVLSVSGKLRCSGCEDELGQGSAMVIESLGLYYHIECFRCCVCNIPLSSSFEGTDVRVRNNRLHCQNCFSDENGVKLSAV